MAEAIFLKVTFQINLSFRTDKCLLFFLSFQCNQKDSSIETTHICLNVSKVSRYVNAVEFLLLARIRTKFLALF